jgi:L,D-transpeptidase ErfK/SrfK
MRLFFYPETQEGETSTVVTHPIGIGRENWQTPKGLTKVVKKVASPSWYVPPSIRAEHAAAGDPLPAVVPPGPDNPLGRYAMRLDIPNYLIHGTNKPAGIGMRVSHGCVQLYPEDIETLFDQVPVGTEVHIVSQPYLAGWHDGALFLEAHQPLAEERGAWADDLEPMVRAVEKAAKKRANDSTPVDWQKTQILARLGRGFPAPILVAGTPNVNEVLSTLPVYHTPPTSLKNEEGATPAENEPWYVQAGSFRRSRNARKLVAMLKELGPSISARYVSAGGRHRVLAGPFVNRGEAESSANRIESSLGAETVILRSDEL